MAKMRALLVVMLLGTLARASEPPASRPPSEADRFIERTKQLFDAMVHKDAATLDALLARDFVFTSFAGATGNRQQYLDAATKVMTIRSYKISPVTVQLHGAAAVIVYRLSIVAQVGGKPWPGELTSTDVWVKQGEAWKLAARHSSVVMTN